MYYPEDINDFEYLVKELVSRGVDINGVDKSSISPIFYSLVRKTKASDEVSTKRVEILLNNGANANYITDKGSNPLHWAVDNYNIDNIKLLVDNGADICRVNSDNITPLEKVYYNVFTRIKEYEKFIDEAFNYMASRIKCKHSSNLKSLLYQLVYYNEYEKVETLLKAGLDPNELNPLKKNALDLAIQKGNERMINLLKKYGAIE
jgi:ankyrin repeat protein